MKQASPGSTATLEATFIASNGSRVDVDNLSVDIVDSDNSIDVNDAVPDHLSLGLYQYDYEVPLDALLGVFRIEWHGEVNGIPVFGFENFEIVAVVVVPEDDTLKALRARLGDEEGASDPFFDDDQLNDILSYANQNLDLATLEGWRRKEARYARLIDVHESGTDRELSQKFKAAHALVLYWGKVIGDDATSAQEGLSGRVVGRVVRLNRRECTNLDFPPFPNRSESDVVVEFPYHQIIVAGT